MLWAWPLRMPLFARLGKGDLMDRKKPTQRFGVCGFFDAHTRQYQARSVERLRCFGSSNYILQLTRVRVWGF